MLTGGSPRFRQEARLMEEKIRQVREMVSERLASLAPNMAMQQVGNSAVVQSRENTRTQQKNDEELPASIDRQLARQLLDQVLIPDTKVSFESIGNEDHTLILFSFSEELICLLACSRIETREATNL